MPRNKLLITAGLGPAIVAVPTAAFAEAPVHTGTFSNIAVSGYDAVTNFTQGKPVKGDARYSVTYKGAEWRFASAQHLAA